MKKYVDGNLVDMTPEEISERETFISIAKQKHIQRNTEVQAKEDAQVSGNQKLLDLGLTQAEATALTGYTPPSEE